MDRFLCSTLFEVCQPFPVCGYIIHTDGYAEASLYQSPLFGEQQWCPGHSGHSGVLRLDAPLPASWLELLMGKFPLVEKHLQAGAANGPTVPAGSHRPQYHGPTVPGPTTGYIHFHILLYHQPGAL